MHTSGLVSIVLPTYNRGEMLKKTITSIISQTYTNWELIIVDDASNDNTAEIVKGMDDSRICYVKNEKNCGSNYSRNRGAELANGEFLAFIDSDNEWIPNKLERQISCFEMQSELALVFCKVLFKEGSLEKIVPNEPLEDLKEIMVRKNVVDTSAALMRKAAFDQVGKFDEKISRLQDWDLFFRFIVVYELPALCVDECLDINHIQADSITKNNWKLFDSMVYFMIKYEKWYNSMTTVRKHIIMMLHEAMNEEEYTYAYRKILDLISNNDNLLKEYIQQKELSFGRFDEKKQREKYQTWYRTLYKWKKRNAEEGALILKYISNCNVENVGIYGLGKWGELIYDEIKNQSDFCIYGIDEKKTEFHSIEIKKINDNLNGIELIIVSVFMEFNAIKENLERNGYKGKIVSISSIIDAL
ncbi:MAG: glycosyltransferase family 2 protein [Lachnospiraceae bacterium]|nr:glycosyltransferase family 2 protein [Lachnospiraceae bacterium]